MWVALSLLSALGGAGPTFMLKRAVAGGAVLEATAAFRAIAGVLLAALALAAGAWPTLGAGYWRATALVMVPEVVAMISLSMALRAGDLSHVQPLLGTLPLFVTLFGMLFLGEVPSPLAALGIALVTLGVYAVGLTAGGSALGPFRALARSRAGWFALAASAAWGLATIVHKTGIREVGPFAWGATLALGPALVVALAIPVVARHEGARPRWDGGPRWLAFVIAAGACFAVQQIGLHLALGATQAGYVIALTSTSTLVAIALGIVVLGERSGARARVVGGVLVTVGAAIIALAE